MFLYLLLEKTVHFYTTRKHSPFLKMLGLYLYTLRINHKLGNMLSILNKLTLQKELQTFVTNNVFLEKKTKNTTTIKQ